MKRAYLYTKEIDRLQFIRTTGVNKLRMKIAPKYLHSFILHFFYAFSHSTMESRIGLRILPKSLNAYSTLGGTSADGNEEIGQISI